MSDQNGGPPVDRRPNPDAVLAAAQLLLGVIEHDARDGMSNRVAVLSAAAELGIDPAQLLHRTESKQCAP